jgi:hypothetical protein
LVRIEGTGKSGGILGGSTHSVKGYVDKMYVDSWRYPFTEPVRPVT